MGKGGRLFTPKKKSPSLPGRVTPFPFVRSLIAAPTVERHRLAPSSSSSSSSGGRSLPRSPSLTLASFRACIHSISPPGGRRKKKGADELWKYEKEEEQRPPSLAR